MQLKRLLLTPLLFAQMWVGAGVLPLKTDPLQEASTSVTLRVANTQAAEPEKIDEKTLLVFCLFALLVSVVCFGKKYFVSLKVTFKVRKEHVRQYLSFLNRSFSKSKNAYYWHFYSALNLLKSS